MGQGLFKSSYFYDLKKVQYTEEQKRAIEKLIREEPFVIFSKNYCPHCIATKRLLENHNVTTVLIRDINTEDDGLETQAILYEMYGQKSVPNIFIKGTHIGGNSQLQRLAKSGQLKKMLDMAGIANGFS